MNKARVIAANIMQDDHIKVGGNLYRVQYNIKTLGLNELFLYDPDDSDGHVACRLIFGNEELVTIYNQ